MNFTRVAIPLLLALGPYTGTISVGEVVAPPGTTEWRFPGHFGPAIGTGQIQFATGFTPGNTGAVDSLTTDGTYSYLEAHEHNAGTGGYHVLHGVGNSGTPIAQYAIVFDAFVPGTTGPNAIYQANEDNNVDATLLLDASANGGTASWPDSASVNNLGFADGWHRWVFLNNGDTNVSTLYLDGAPVGTAANPTGTPGGAVNDALDPDLAGFWFLADDTLDTDTIRISAFAFVPQLLSVQQVETLGGADPDGIFVPVPEPGTWVLLVVAFAAAVVVGRSMKRQLVPVRVRKDKSDPPINNKRRCC